MSSHVENLERILGRFARPRATSRTGTPDGAPEDDVMTVEVTTADWMRACAAVGSMDGEMARALPAHARPSKSFCDDLDAIYRARMNHG